MGHIHSVYDTDAHFKINPITRKLSAEGNSQVSLVQFDHNSERFTFEIPKLIEGHDMSSCNKVEVHFINEDLQGKVTTYETQISNLQEQLKQTQIESAVKVALLGARVTDVDYMTFKLKEKGELELAEDGSIKGIEDKLSALKTQFPNQFESASGKNGKVFEVNKLPNNDNNGGITKETFDKMGYQERVKLFNESPDVYAELSKN